MKRDLLVLLVYTILDQAAKPAMFLDSCNTPFFL